MARFRRSASAEKDAETDLNFEELRAQAAASMERAQRLSSEDPLVRAQAVQELRAENAALFYSGQRRPSVIGWYRGPGDPPDVERYWDGTEWTELIRDPSAPVQAPEILPFAGEILWLSAEQGGRAAGPPWEFAGRDYTASAFVPPSVIEVGLTPIVVRGFESGAWRSNATAGWLTHDGNGPRGVRPGSLVVITEETTRVGYFAVTAVEWPEAGEDATGPDAAGA